MTVIISGGHDYEAAHKNSGGQKLWGRSKLSAAPQARPSDHNFLEGRKLWGLIKTWRAGIMTRSPIHLLTAPVFAWLSGFFSAVYVLRCLCSLEVGPFQRCLWSRTCPLPEHVTQFDTLLTLEVLHYNKCCLFLNNVASNNFHVNWNTC